MVSRYNKLKILAICLMIGLLFVLYITEQGDKISASPDREKLFELKGNVELVERVRVEYLPKVTTKIIYKEKRYHDTIYVDSIVFVARKLDTLRIIDSSLIHNQREYISSLEHLDSVNVMVIDSLKKTPCKRSKAFMRGFGAGVVVGYFGGAIFR